MKKIIFISGLFLVALALSPLSVSAQEPSSKTFENNPAIKPVGEDGGQGSNNPINSSFQIVSCRGIDDPRTTADDNLPDCDYKQLIASASRLLQFILYMLIPIVLGMIVFIGFKYLTANGDSGKLADAKGMIKPLLIGVFLVFGAWLIVYSSLNFLLDDDVSGVPKSDIVPAGIK